MGLGSVRFTVGLIDLKNLFQTKWFYDSMPQGKARKRTYPRTLGYVITFWVTSISFQSPFPPRFLPAVLFPQCDSSGSAAMCPCPTYTMMHFIALLFPQTSSRLILIFCFTQNFLSLFSIPQSFYELFPLSLLHSYWGSSYSDAAVSDV